jgi:hypothetical protein
MICVLVWILLKVTENIASAVAKKETTELHYSAIFQTVH